MISSDFLTVIDVAICAAIESPEFNRNLRVI